MAYLTEASKRALSEAVAAIELGSSAEIVVAIRPASAPAALPAALAAVAGMTLGLAFLLFSPWPFSHAAILLDTLLAGALAAYLGVRFPWLRRALTPPSVARAQVDQAARGEFVAQGIARTRDRTGLLVYVSQVERRACIVADQGVEPHVDRTAFTAALTRIEASVARGEDAEALAAAVRALAPVLASGLPRRSDDINELGDAVC